jgi:hypothetical protein
MRLLVGYGFIEHGFAKLSRGPDAFAVILQQMGVPLPHVAAWMTIGTELVGGLALLLGAFVLWASIPTAGGFWPQVEDQSAAYQTEPEARRDERNQHSGREAGKDHE